MAVIYPALTFSYSKAIYVDGMRTFPEIRPEYVEPVKQYAAANYTQAQIDKALANGWITQKEYEDTLAYVTAQ